MKPRTWGVGAVVPVRRMDPPVYALPEGLEPGVQVRVMSISPGYCRVKLAAGSDGREWTVAWPLLEGWTARSLRVNPPKRGAGGIPPGNSSPSPVDFTERGGNPVA